MKLEHTTNNLLKSRSRTPLHWACKRNHEDLVKVLLENGANPELKNCVGERPANLCNSLAILELLGENTSTVPKENVYNVEPNLKFVPNYINYPSLNGQVDVRSRLHSRHPDFSSLPTTSLPSQTHGTYTSDTPSSSHQTLLKLCLDLVLKIRVAGSNDPDYVEVEVPRWKLTYVELLKIFCEELNVAENRVERIRKMPNTRLRNDSDVRRLLDMQCLEIVLKTLPDTEKHNNNYQSISTHRDQMILY